MPLDIKVPVEDDAKKTVLIEYKTEDKEEVKKEPPKPKRAVDKRVLQLPITDAGEASEHLRMLVYGDSGVGKTRLLASAYEVPDMRPLLLVDFDPGTMSISRLYPKLKVMHAEKIAHLDMVLTLIREGKLKIRTLVLDDLQGLYVMYMRERLAFVTSNKENRSNVTPAQDDWGYCTNQMRDMIYRAKRLPIHLICSTMATIFTDEQTSTTYRMPMLPGKMAKEVTKFWDIVGYMTTDSMGQKITRAMQVQPIKRTAAKDRTDQLGTIVKEPTMQVIYDAAFKGVTPAQEEVQEDVPRKVSAEDAAFVEAVIADLESTEGE